MGRAAAQSGGQARAACTIDEVPELYLLPTCAVRSGWGVCRRLNGSKAGINELMTNNQLDGSRVSIHSSAPNRDTLGRPVCTFAVTKWLTFRSVDPRGKRGVVLSCRLCCGAEPNRQPNDA